MTLEHLGPYRVERELGAGGMGKVFAAVVEGRCPGLDVGTRVALKVVHPHLLETAGFFRRFLREAEIGAAVEHPNVVRTYLADALGTEHFLVMEYVEGQTLRELLAELERVPEELCRHIGREVAKGLSAIHDAGVVHRDLKPENVLITPEHEVKVMDLGVARLQDEAVRLSQTGAFVGSVEYAAPEQFRDGDVDHRCDLHALGLLLYELACGQHPFRADEFRVVLHSVLNEEPRQLGEINPQLSPFFEEVVHKLVAKRADDRFADANALLAVLEEGESSAWWRERALSLRATTKRPLRRIRIPRETAVYGREKELQRLRGLYDRAKSGDGQVALIEGEAGIGKSRLVDELIAQLQADGEDLSFLYGSYPPGGAALAAGGFSSAYRDHFGEGGSAEFLTQTPLLAPAFDAVLRGEPAPSGVVELTKDSLGTCFVHATRNLAEERPTVVLIDDLHFAPEEARALFTALALAVPGHRVLLIGTMRPGVPEDWVANVSRLDHVSHMDVIRLGPKDLMDLLRDSFSSEALAEQLGVQIATKSDGNPFFAFEIIRGLREGQFITQKDDGTWASTQVIDEIQIPSSVLDLVNARVADLSEEERDLLDVAACWGYEFDPALLSDVTAIARIPLYKRLAQIERAHRLVRSSGRRFVFDHHQVQEALYSSLPEVLREEYHGALAEALETRTGAAETDPDELDGALCVDLCEHFLRGARGEDALRYLEAAQTHLEKGYLQAEMVALTERALASPHLLVGIERAKALLRLASVEGPLDSMGRRSRQEEHAREAQRLSDAAGEDGLRALAAISLGWCLFETSRYAESEKSYGQVIELALALGDRSTEAVARGGLGVVYFRQGLVSQAEECLERSLVLCREIGDRPGEAKDMGNLGLVFMTQGRIAEARDHFQRALALGRENGSPHGEAMAMGNLGNVFSAQGRFSEAREHYRRQLALSREIGARRIEAGAVGSLGNLLGAQGRLSEAEEHYQRVLVLSREIGDRLYESRSLGNLGAILSRQGRSSEAEEHWERQLALSREIGDRQGEAYAQHYLADVYREEGELERSEERLLACLALCEQFGHRSLRVATQLALGSLRAAAGDLDGGRQQLAAARDTAREMGLPGNEVLARCELARLPGGDVADAIASLREHGDRIDVEHRSRARYLLWKATGDRAHLAEVKRLLDEALASVPAEYRDSMCQTDRVNREILAAWREEFGDDAGDDSPGTEPVTKAGL